MKNIHECLQRQINYAESVINTITNAHKNNSRNNNIICEITNLVPKNRAPLNTLNVSKRYHRYRQNESVSINEIKVRRLDNFKNKVVSLYTKDANSIPAPGACEFVTHKKQKK